MKPRVFIALAFYDQVYPETIDCVTHSETLTIYNENTRIRSSSIDLARSELAGRFLEWRGPNGECATHMMCVDADVWWRDDLITQLVEEDSDIILGAYRTRVYPFSFHFRFIDGVYQINGCPSREGKNGKIIQIAATGIGATLIKREVIEVMYDFFDTEDNVYHSYEGEKKRVHLFQKLVFSDERGVPRGYGEDYGFFHRAAQSRFKVECLTTAQLKHAGVPGEILTEMLMTPE